MIKRITDSDLDSLYTAKTLSKKLGVSERQIHYYRENKQLKSEIKSRARFVFPKESVIEFLVNRWGFEYADQ